VEEEEAALLLQQSANCLDRLDRLEPHEGEGEDETLSVNTIKFLASPARLSRACLPKPHSRLASLARIMAGLFFLNARSN
jgi:hypothetical protein